MYKTTRNKIESNKHILRTVCVTIFLLFQIGNVGAIPVEQWNKTFGGVYYDGAEHAWQTSDGGYIVAGATMSYGAGNMDAYLFKTDVGGNLQWSKTFGGESDDIGLFVQPTMDGGYIIAGRAHSYGVNYDAWIIKTDASGNEQWNKTFGPEQVSCVRQTSDGGYIISGQLYNNSHYAGIIKTDQNGNEQWRKLFEDGRDGSATSVQQTSDGGYIIAGYKIVGYNSQYASLGLLFIKTDTSGNEQWNFGGLELPASSVQQTIDGGYIIAGREGPYFVDPNAYLIKLDVNGNEQWHKTFGGTGKEEATSVQQTRDEGYIFAGYTSDGLQASDAWLVKTDKNGDEQWNKRFYGPNDEVAMSVQQTLDGGYVLSGHEGPALIGKDAWLIKVSGDIGQVHNVNKGTDYTAIQTAIDDANTGDEIHVDSGTYYENVNITKQLILKGIDTGGGRPTIDANYVGNAIAINVDGVAITGFRIIHSAGVYSGIKIVSDNNIISDNIMFDDGYGINLLNSNNNILNNNDISDGSGGIFLQSSNNNIVNDNYVSNVHDSITLTGSNSNTLNDNSVINNAFGIWLGYSNSNSLIHNDIKNNDADGIHMGGSSDNVMSKNNISNNMRGIILDWGSSNNRIYDNYLDNTDNLIFDNPGSNSLNVPKISGTNIVGGFHIGGNFWANPSGNGYSQTCIDTDNDGICDSSYTFNSDNIDYLPLAYNQSYICGNTPVGQNIQTNPSSNIDTVFDNIAQCGDTSAIAYSNNQWTSLPSNYKGIIFHDIETTATYTNSITTNIRYLDSNIPSNVEESSLRLFHYENGNWIDITTSLDTINNKITGATNILSPFAIAGLSLGTPTPTIGPTISPTPTVSPTASPTSGNVVRGSSFGIIGIAILSICLIIVSLLRLRMKRK